MAGSRSMSPPQEGAAQAKLGEAASLPSGMLCWGAGHNAAGNQRTSTLAGERCPPLPSCASGLVEDSGKSVRTQGLQDPLQWSLLLAEALFLHPPPTLNLLSLHVPSLPCLCLHSLFATWWLHQSLFLYHVTL